MTAPDSAVSEWITGLAGRCSFCDDVMSLLASDFFIPVSMSMFMLFLWFGTGDPDRRKKNQYGAMCASASLGFANLAVHLLNQVLEFDPWIRPFEAHESAARAAELILYFPHDPSFPANMAASTFGAAVGMWIYSRKTSIPIFAIAIAWSFARIYAGIHYPLDILGGTVIGAVIALGTWGLMRLIWPLPAVCFWFAKKLYAA